MLLHANYFIMDNFYAGVNLGLANATATSSVGILSTTVGVGSGLSFGAQAGYMFKLGESISITPEATFHMAMLTPTAGGASTTSMWATGLVRFGYHL